MVSSKRDEAEVDEDEEENTEIDADRAFIKNQSNMNTVRNI
jgi:hypothetical protein